MKLVFRVDSSSKIGLGHLSRCLEIADKANLIGHKTIFFCKNINGNLSYKINKKKHSVFFLKNSSNKNFKENEFLEKINTIKNIDWVIIDGYQFKNDLIKKINKYNIKTLTLSDEISSNYKSKININQSFYGSLKYTGKKYYIINKEIQKYKNIALKKINNFSKIEKLLINFGGENNYIATLTCLKILNNIQKKKNYKKIVIIFASNFFLTKNEKNFNKKLSCLKNIRDIIQIKSKIKNIGKLFSTYDLAIGSAGISMAERFYLGLPSLVLKIAKNQSKNFRYAIRNDLIFPINSRKNKISKKKFLHNLSIIENNENYLRNVKKIIKIFDGKGVHRVLDCLNEK